MRCYHPLTAWRGPVLASGKRSVVFKRGESTPALSAFPQKLPCGQCIGCRLAYSLDWASRCMAEAQMHEKKCFVTLTYDDDHLVPDVVHSHLRLKDGKLVSDGTCIGYSVCVWEFQKFMKRLRKFFKVSGIRFFHAGEYGERFGRPHYHALLFGVDFPDRVPLRQTDAGSIIYSSKVLSQIWGKGYCSIGDVTFESAAYVARYCVKKITGAGKEVRDARGLLPYERVDVVSGEVHSVKGEYVTMSRRPGIAKSWFDKYKSDVYPHDYFVRRGGVKMPPPRYFDGLYELEDPIDMARIKLHRMSRCGGKELVWSDVLQKLQKLDKNRDDRLVVMEEVKKCQIKNLKRRVDYD